MYAIEVKMVLFELGFYKSGTLSVIPMVMTKRISKNIYKRNWEGNQNSSLQKDQLNIKEGSNRGNEGQEKV